MAIPKPFMGYSSKSEAYYRLRCQGKTWAEICKIGGVASRSGVRRDANRFAKREGLPAPIPARQGVRRAAIAAAKEEALDLRSGGMTQSAIAEKVGLSQSVISLLFLESDKQPRMEGKPSRRASRLSDPRYEDVPHLKNRPWRPVTFAPPSRYINTGARELYTNE